MKSMVSTQTKVSDTQKDTDDTTSGTGSTPLGFILMGSNRHGWLLYPSWIQSYVSDSYNKMYVAYHGNIATFALPVMFGR